MIKGIDAEAPRRKRKSPPLPLFEGNEIIDRSRRRPRNSRSSPRSYTEHAVSFIDRNKDQPFFLYVPHTMVHVPLVVSDKFKDKSGAGLFGDVRDGDRLVGRPNSRRASNATASTTTRSSSSPPTTAPGSTTATTPARPARCAKARARCGKAATASRASCAGRAKSRPARSATNWPSTIDVFPTVAKLIGAEVPTDRMIDGKDIWPLMAGEAGAKSPHEAFYCYYDRELRAVRDRRWKLVFPHEYRSLDGKPGGRDGVPANYKQLKTESGAVRSQERRRRNDGRRGRASRHRRPARARRRKGPRHTGRHADRSQGQRSAAPRQGCEPSDAQCAALPQNMP